MMKIKNRFIRAFVSGVVSLFKGLLVLLEPLVMYKLKLKIRTSLRMKRANSGGDYSRLLGSSDKNVEATKTSPAMSNQRVAKKK
jgi:hypothetical protein